MYVVIRVSPANAYTARRLGTPRKHGDRQHTKARTAVYLLAVYLHRGYLEYGVGTGAVGYTS